MNSLKRWFLIVICYLAIFPIIATPCFLSVFFLAGPHGGILPSSFQPVILITALLILITVPLYLTYLIAKRLPKN